MIARVQIQPARARLCGRCFATVHAAAVLADHAQVWEFDHDCGEAKAAWALAVKGCKCVRRCANCGADWHPTDKCPIPRDYAATPANAIEGGCGCKK